MLVAWPLAKFTFSLGQTWMLTQVSLASKLYQLIMQFLSPFILKNRKKKKKLKENKVWNKANLIPSHLLYCWSPGDQEPSYLTCSPTFRRFFSHLLWPPKLRKDLSIFCPVSLVQKKIGQIPWVLLPCILPYRTQPSITWPGDSNVYWIVVLTTWGFYCLW